MGVALGGTEVGVAEECLDIAYVGAVFKEVGGKGMTEAMDGCFFGDLGAADGVFKNFLGGTDR